MSALRYLTEVNSTPRALVEWRGLSQLAAVAALLLDARRRADRVRGTATVQPRRIEPAGEG
jgi:hypothetical protein